MAQITDRNYHEVLARLYPLFQNLIALPLRSRVHLNIRSSTVSSVRAYIGQGIRRACFPNEDLLTSEEKLKLHAFWQGVNYIHNEDFENAQILAFGHKFAETLYSADYFYTSGECGEFKKETLLSAHTAASRNAPGLVVEKQVFAEDFRPDLFLAYCVLKQLGRVSDIIRFRETKLNQLPDYSHYPDIVCMEDEETGELHVI